MGGEIEEFLRMLAVGRQASSHTVRAYRSDLTMFFEWLAKDKGAPAIDDVEPHHVRLYLGGIGGSHGRATISRKAAAIRSFFRHLVRSGRLTVNPAALVRSKSAPRRLPHVLTTTQVSALLDAPAGPTFLATRDRAILEFLYSTGARVSEACRLELPELDLDEGVARLFGKGRKVRLAPIGSYARRAIETYLCARATRPKSILTKRVFLNARGTPLSDRSVRRILKHRLAQADLPSSVTPHTLRHCFASHLLAAGANLRAVQELLGHRSINTTQIYTRVSPEHLRHVYESAHPRAAASASADASATE